MDVVDLGRPAWSRECESGLSQNAANPTAAARSALSFAFFASSQNVGARLVLRTADWAQVRAHLRIFQSLRKQTEGTRQGDGLFDRRLLRQNPLAKAMGTPPLSDFGRSTRGRSNDGIRSGSRC